MNGTEAPLSGILNGAEDELFTDLATLGDRPRAEVVPRNAALIVDTLSVIVALGRDAIGVLPDEDRRARVVRLALDTLFKTAWKAAGGGAAFALEGR